MVQSTGVLLASGNRATLRYARESVRGTAPAAIATPVTNIAAVATGTGTSQFTRASGSFVTDGFIKGQKVRTAGFATAANNADWIVHDVSASTLTVRDPNDVIVGETAQTVQTVRILLLTLRSTGRNINVEKNVLESQEVDEDGQETDARHGFQRTVGAPGFQLSRADYDNFIEYAMGREWDLGSTVVSTGVNLSVNASTKVITRTSGSWITLGFRPGDIVLGDNFTNDGNDGQRRVTAVTANNLTVSDPDNTMVSETAGSGKTVTLVGKRIDVGTEMMTLMIERAFSDIAQYQRFTGCAIDQFGLTIEPESMVNGTFNILGMLAAAVAGSSLSGVSPLTHSGNSPYAAFEGEIFENGSIISVVTALNFTLARNRSLNAVVGAKTSPDVFDGTAKLSGTLSAYFDSAALLNRFINETESTIWLRMDDPNAIGTHFMNIVFPRVKYNGGTIDPPQEGPVVMEMPFRALKATGLALPGGTTRNTLMTIQVSNDLDI